MKSDMEFCFSSTRLGPHVPQPKAQEESGVIDLLAARQPERKKENLSSCPEGGCETPEMKHKERRAHCAFPCKVSSFPKLSHFLRRLRCSANCLSPFAPCGGYGGLVGGFLPARFINCLCLRSFHCSFTKSNIWSVLSALSAPLREICTVCSRQYGMLPSEIGR